MSQPLAIELAGSAERAASGSGAAVDLGVVSTAEGAPARSAARLEISVSAYANVERVRLVVQHAGAEAGPWVELDALDVEQTGDYELSVGGTRRWLRLSWEFFGPGGSPAVTFSVAGAAHQIYFGPKDLGRCGLPRSVIDDRITKSAQADACIRVSDEADGYLGARYTLPMLAWDDGLRGHGAAMAVRYGFDACGWQPEGPDAVIEAAFDRGLAWLKRLADGKLEPPGMVDSTPEVFEGGSVVVSRPRRSAL
jgi:phage gp36-like protein